MQNVAVQASTRAQAASWHNGSRTTATGGAAAAFLSASLLAAAAAGPVYAADVVESFANKCAGERAGRGARTYLAHAAALSTRRSACLVLSMLVLKHVLHFSALDAAVAAYTCSLTRASVAACCCHRCCLCAAAAAGCHLNGGNVLQPGATLFADDLERNGVSSPEALYQIIYSGKKKMPGFGKDCAPKVRRRGGARGMPVGRLVPSVVWAEKQILFCGLFHLLILTSARAPGLGKAARCYFAQASVLPCANAPSRLPPCPSTSYHDHEHAESVHVCGAADG